MFHKIKNFVIYLSWAYIIIVIIKGFGDMGRDIVEYRKNKNLATK